jgi:hypothetical protein
MRPGSIITLQPYVQVFLQFFYVEINLFPEGDTVKLIEDSLWNLSQMPFV